MSTSVSYLKGSIKIQCNTSLYPAPRPQAAWPIPNFPSAQTSLLALSLVVITGQGASGIQVLSAGTLPGGPTAVWTLFHQYWQGTPATLPQPDAISLSGGTINITLSSPMAGATHVFWLSKVEAGQTSTYLQASITTPVDPTGAAIVAAVATAAAIAAEQTIVAALGVTGLCEVYLGSQLNLQWNPFLTAPDALVEVRMGKTWASALTLGQTKTVNFVTIADGTFWVCPFYQGTYGIPVSISVTGTTLLANQLISYDECGSGLTGALGGSALKAWNIVYLPAGATSGSYTSAQIINVGTPQLVTLGVAYTLITASSVITVDQWTDVASQTDVEQLSPAGTSGNTALQVNISVDPGTGVFGPWLPFSPGPYFGARFQLQWVLTSTNATIAPYLTACSWTASVPDRVQRCPNGTATTLTTGPLAFTFSTPFQIVPTIAPSILNQQAGDIAVYTATTNGLSISVQNPLLTYVPRTISWLASGY